MTTLLLLLLQSYCRGMWDYKIMTTNNVVCCVDGGNTGDRLLNINSFGVHKCTVPGCGKVCDSLTDIRIHYMCFIRYCTNISENWLLLKFWDEHSCEVDIPINGLLRIYNWLYLCWCRWFMEICLVIVKKWMKMKRIATAVFCATYW